jgi:hypothetical protein
MAREHPRAFEPRHSRHVTPMVRIFRFSGTAKRSKSSSQFRIHLTIIAKISDPIDIHRA